ncbi:single-stranded DNA-binding protein [Sporosarcina sp. ANT_H38]|uniref:single-stranded DNA-binding protein n=1 Tax=Sporosarcina sp. ANT_H38 TaxID=2597358 RepID=UPI0011F0BD1D|nr:single-stranded DNA-binding protein [Sporosarcina sp. ANT_H38]KAA0955628.1 single-stranded DNA-binding protein [Sporosarcina sp. ANT_H38]
MNQVALVGRITKDPILRKVSEGRVQTSFVLAVNRNFKNQKGEVETDFVLCTMWGKAAENTAKHCGKGSLVGVGGRIQSRSYERADKSRVYVTEVIGEDVRFILTKKRSNDNLYSEQVGSMTLPVEGKGDAEHFNLPNRETAGLPIF